MDENRTSTNTSRYLLIGAMVAFGWITLTLTSAFAG